MRGIGLALLTLLVASSAQARKVAVAGDSEDPTDPVIVRASLDGITAKFVVDYHVPTTTLDSSTVLLSLAVPKGGVVTGATITHDGTVHRLALGASADVETQFSAAFGEAREGATPDIWVAKITMDSYGMDGTGVTAVIVAPIETEVVLSLEMSVPTCFLRDRRYVRVPAGWEGVAHTKNDEQVARVCDATGTDGPWVSFAAPEPARLPDGERLLAQSARLAIDDDLHLARTELALAASIADVPRDLATVILVDESRSMTNEQRRSQRETVLGYLRAAPNSRVQVIAFSRRTRALLPGWTVASRAIARLDRELASLTPRNGSNFDRGLEVAARLLANVRGTRRVLLVTDEAMASRIANAPERLAKLVSADTIINTVATADVSDTDADGDVKVTRADNAQLARLAAATSGFATVIGQLEDKRTKPVDAAMLVRPMSLDHISATGLGWMDLDVSTRSSLVGSTCTASLDAGDSCIFWTRGTKFAGPIQLEGLLWNRRVVRIVRPLGDPGHTIAREIVGTGTAVARENEPDGGADETELHTKLDALAHAVTSTTSLFARWGGNVPYAEGLAFGGFGGYGRSSDIDGIGTLGRGRLTSIAPVELASQLQSLVEVCQLGSAHASVTMELTFEEIVDVNVAIDGGGARTSALKTCVEEIVWDFTPAIPTLESFRTVSVRL